MKQQYHRHFSHDSSFILTKFAPSSEELAKREQTIGDVRKALEHLCRNDFFVEDCSLHKYAVDIHDAPLELVVVDKNHPRGIPPGTDLSSLPDIYDPSRVARALMDAGFQGGFVSYSPDEDPGPANGARPRRPKNLRDSTVPWPEYQHTYNGEPLYPPQLQVKTPVSFMLTLPGSTVLPLYNLLAAGDIALPNTLREFISLVYIWTRSWGLTEFTSTCLALIAIRSIQETIGPEKLNFFRHARELHEGGWVLCEYRGASSQHHLRFVRLATLDASFTTQKVSNYDKSMGWLLHEFFNIWRNASTIARRQTISIREYEHPSHREALDPSRRGRPKRSWVDNDNPYRISLPSRCFFVQDPFISTHNHAEGVSNETLRYFAYQAIRATRSIWRRLPLVAIFGSSFTPPGVNRPEESSSNLGRPAEVRPSTFSTKFRSECKAFCETVEPHDSVASLRSQTLRRVQNVISSYGRQYTVEVFGSTQYGVSSCTSDLDLVVVDSLRANGFSPDVNINTLPSIYNIRQLGVTLRNSGFVNVRSIPSASVPIVKCTDPDTRLACDINVNDQLGLLNTKMIKRYCDISPILRPMIMFIKHWARPLGLNNPSKTGAPVTFSSYALVLMTIGFLQTRGLLPNLQEGLRELNEDATDAIFWIRTKKGSVGCDTRFQHEAQGWVPQESANLEETLRDWFWYWGHDYLYAKHTLSVREGGIVPRLPRESEPDEDQPSEVDAMEEDLSESETLQPLDWEKHELAVADPFIRTKNVTGAISKLNVERFRMDCQRVTSILHWGGDLKNVFGEGTHAERKRIPPTPPSDVPVQAGSNRTKGKQRESGVSPGRRKRIPEDKRVSEGQVKERGTPARLSGRKAVRSKSKLFEAAVSDVRKEKAPEEHDDQ